MIFWECENSDLGGKCHNQANGHLNIHSHYAVFWIVAEMNKQESQTMKSLVYQFKLERKKEEKEGERKEEKEKEGEREGST